MAQFLKMNWQALLPNAKSFIGPVIASTTGGVASAAVAAYALPALGFGSLGVKAASAAAVAQSVLFAGSVPAGGWFATMTSWGATGAAAGPLAAVAGPVGGVAAGAAWWYFRK